MDEKPAIDTISCRKSREESSYNMRKNKISDIFFGLLFFGFLVSNLTGCGSTPTPAFAPVSSGARQTEASRETEGETASQETEETSAAQDVEENEERQETAELPESIVFAGPEDKDCTSYVIPDGVTEIGENAFSGCKSLTAVEIPDSVTKIGENAFYECKSLTAVEIPDSVTEIGEGAFCFCNSLTAVEIPDSVTKIGERAFKTCTSLAAVEIPDGVTEIGTRVFDGCMSLTAVEIPDSVTEIGAQAFYSCSSLTAVEIPDSVAVIGNHAFYGCKSLTAVEIPDSVTKIGNEAFVGCSSLSYVRLPENSDIDLKAVFGIRYNDIQFIYGDEADFAVGSDIDSIKSVCGLEAPVETDIEVCHWDSYGEHPYDVVYNYGVKYMAYVDACDWSLVFDADYYMDTFPMLALQYHYDEDELLFHFQTIGIHEGRQGSADFNVYCYAMNSDIGLAFDSYEGYYLYYMLNYDTEKEVNTVMTEDMSEMHTMYEFHPTAMQQAELEAVNADRKEVGVADLKMYHEICALAGYRAYINAHDGYEAHDWAKENTDLLRSYAGIMGCSNVWGENTFTKGDRPANGMLVEPYYYDSQPHYEAMVAPKYNYIGVSNMCNGKHSSSQFDFFLDTIN